MVRSTDQLMIERYAQRMNVRFETVDALIINIAAGDQIAAT